MCAIVGAFSDGARTGCVGLTSCDAFDLAATINGVEDVIQHLCANHPEIELFAKVLGEKTKENKEDK